MTIQCHGLLFYKDMQLATWMGCVGQIWDYVSPQNMQGNLKTNEDISERHNLFRGGGSLFNLRFTPATLALYVGS